jgi:hypothetical protein
MSLRLSATTELAPEQVIERAARYFGDEFGLAVAWRSPLSARFEGGGGHVQVSAAAALSGAEVELETMEWEIQVRQFAADLPR